MAVLINRPFGGGNIFGKLLKLPVPDWAAEFDCRSWGQFLLKYVLSHPAVTCTIPGMTKARHVEDNMAAAMGRMPDKVLRRKQESFLDAL
jgi:aryl-alcohol dehydrogenase-like predicted oxidoreductase